MTCTTTKTTATVQDLVRQAEDEDYIKKSDDDDQSILSSNTGANDHNDDMNTIMEIHAENNETSVSIVEDVAADVNPKDDDTATLVVPPPPPSRDIQQAPPSPRWGHTMTPLDGNRILIYGGQSIDYDKGATKTFSDIHVYDIAKRTWCKPVNCEGMPRQWHTATYLPERQLLISFGGESVNPKTGKTKTTDQVRVLDTEIMLWYPPAVTGDVPSGRSGHTATLFETTNELVVFGGVKGSKHLNSVAVLDITRWKWSCPKIQGDAPRPRSYHTATAIIPQQQQRRQSSSLRGGGSSSIVDGQQDDDNLQEERNRLVIFGGNNADTSFDTVHVLERDGTKWRWFHPKTSGTAPTLRTGHSSVLLEDKKTILIYGGWDPTADDDGNNNDDNDDDDEMMIFSDSYLLDTETWCWSVGPKPKYYQGSDDTVSSSSSKNGSGGEKRVGHRAVLTTTSATTTNNNDNDNNDNIETNNGKKEVLVFGGRVPNDKFVNDFQTLSVPQSMIGFGG